MGRYGRDAWSSSQTAASDLKTQGFTLGGAIDRVQSRWEEQLTSLLDACAHISNHMDFTKKVHQGDEYYIGGQISSISTLDKGFDGEGALMDLDTLRFGNFASLGTAIADWTRVVGNLETLEKNARGDSKAWRTRPIGLA